MALQLAFGLEVQLNRLLPPTYLLAHWPEALRQEWFHPFHHLRCRDAGRFIRGDFQDRGLHGLVFFRVNPRGTAWNIDVGDFNFLHEQKHTSEALGSYQHECSTPDVAHPFGHKARLQMFMNPDPLQDDEVWAAAGTWNDVFPIPPNDLVRVSGGVVTDLKRA